MHYKKAEAGKSSQTWIRKPKTLKQSENKFLGGKNNYIYKENKNELQRD